MSEEYYRWIELCESVLSVHGNSYEKKLLLEVLEEEESFFFSTPYMTREVGTERKVE